MRMTPRRPMPAPQVKLLQLLAVGAAAASSPHLSTFYLLYLYLSIDLAFVLKCQSLILCDAVSESRVACPTHQ